MLTTLMVMVFGGSCGYLLAVVLTQRPASPKHFARSLYRPRAISTADFSTRCSHPRDSVKMRVCSHRTDDHRCQTGDRVLYCRVCRQVLRLNGDRVVQGFRWKFNPGANQDWTMSSPSSSEGDR